MVDPCILITYNSYIYSFVGLDLFSKYLKQQRAQNKCMKTSTLIDREFSNLDDQMFGTGWAK